MAEADLDVEPVGVGTADLGAWPWSWSGVRAWPAWTVPVALYAVAVTLLTVRLGGHPGFAYNWEGYAAWQLFPFWDRPTIRVFDLTDGLMTDSGRSPLVVFPIWLGWKLGGVGLTATRLPIALIAATAVPLLWLVARRLTGAWIAALAAILLALSPVFLLYGRTATLVGISLVPALVTIAVLLRLLREPQLVRLVALQVLLVANSYGYAPIRFLWFLSLALLAGELLWRPGERRRFALALAVTALVLPAMLTRISGDDPIDAVVGYYNARGEQVFTFRHEPDEYTGYLRLTPEEEAAGQAAGSDLDLARRLITQNAEDLAKMLLDRDRLPSLTDFWNAEGRLYPALLVPFFLLGQLRALLGLRRRVEDRALLALFWGFALPLLLTSRVDVGRLIFALPLLCLFVALGWGWAGTWLLRLAGRVAASEPRRSLVLASTTVVLLALVARSTWEDYHVGFLPSSEAGVADALAAGLPEVSRRGGAALVMGDASQVEIESIAAAIFRLALDNRYRFVNLAEPDAGAGVGGRETGVGTTDTTRDTRPPVYFGGLLDLLASPTAIPGFCENAYYVAPAAVDRFLAAISALPPVCGGPFQYWVLPG